MLLAPFTLSDTQVRPAQRKAPVSRPVPSWLIAWAVLGGLAVLAVPALRGSPATGLTLPFWLVVAPVLDILWLKRRHWLPGALRRRSARRSHA